MADVTPTEGAGKYVYERSRDPVSHRQVKISLERLDALGLDWQYRNIPEILFDFVAFARNEVGGEG